jgi:hypothetical protein
MVRTERNAPLAQVFDDLHFRPVANPLQSARAGASRMELSLDRRVTGGDIVTLHVAPELLTTEQTPA